MQGMSAAKRYLITGGTGFLGRHLLSHLAQADVANQTLLLVRDPASWAAQDWSTDLPTPELIAGGLLNPADWQDSEALGQVDGIFHLAALVRHSRSASEDIYQTNIEGTLNMVRLAAAKGCRLVYVSTSGTVGVFRSARQSADEHDPYLPQAIANWPYYDSKLKAELAARKLARELNVELVIIRPPVMLGPGDHRFRSTGHIIRYLRQKLPFLIEGGMHFVDIRDVAAALLVAMQRPQPQPAYHLAGVACSIGEFFKYVERASGVKPPNHYLPFPVALAIAKTATTLAERLPGHHESPFPDPVVIEMANKYWGLKSRYAEADLGFVNRDGQETIDETVAWLQQHHEKLKRDQ